MDAVLNGLKAGIRRFRKEIYPKNEATYLQAVIQVQAKDYKAADETLVPPNFRTIQAEGVALLELLLDGAPQRGVAGMETRHLLTLPRPVAFTNLVEQHSLDANAAENLLRYLEDQAVARHPHLVGAEARTSCVWINDPAMLATEGPKHRRVRSAPPDQLRWRKTVARYAGAPRAEPTPTAGGLSCLRPVNKERVQVRYRRVLLAGWELGSVGRGS